MRFKLDENLPAEAAAPLIEGGHDAITVRDQGLGGASDAALMNQCTLEGRALVTLDLDFADIRAYPPEGSQGIVVLRVARQDKRSVTAAVGRIVPLVDNESLTGQLWLVEEDRVRIRGPERFP